MTTKIGLVSDVHASPAPLKQALKIFEQEAVSKIICAGDIAGYFENLSETIELLEAHQCETIIGNHDQSFLNDNLDLKESSEYLFLQNLPETLEYKISNIRILVVHAHPPDHQHGGIKLLDQNGRVIEKQKQHWIKELEDFDYDVLVVGHTHQVFAEQLGSTFVVNPGSSQFNHSCMVLSLPDLSVQIFALEDQPILKSWNFSHLFGKPANYPPAKNKSDSR
jgi:putative phosphoesterase